MMQDVEGPFSFPHFQGARMEAASGQKGTIVSVTPSTFISRSPTAAELMLNFAKPEPQL